MVGEGGDDGDGLAAVGELDVGEHEIPVSGQAGSATRQGLVRQRAQPERGHGGFFREEAQMVGIVERPTAVGEQRIIGQALETGVAGGGVGVPADGVPGDLREGVGGRGGLVFMGLVGLMRPIFLRSGGVLLIRIRQQLAALHRDGGAHVVLVGVAVEERVKLVVFPVRDGVVFVGVALGATDGEAEPDGAGGVDAVHHSLDAELLGVGAPFFVDERVAVEGGGGALALGRIGQEIARELFDGELIEGQVAVHGVDHPIAIGPHHAISVDGVAVGVGIPCLVEPVPAPALAVMRIGKQAVHGGIDRGLGIGGVGVEKGVQFLRGRRQAGEVEVQAAQERGGGGFGGRRDALGLQTREDEPIERRAHPGVVRHGGWLGTRKREKGPVAFVGRALFDPAAQRGDIGFGQRRLFGGRRRHHIVGVVTEDADEQFAALGMPGHDGGRAAFQFHRRALEGVQPQAAFALFLIRAVALEAGVGQQRADVAVEAHIGGRGGKHEAEQEAEEGQPAQRHGQAGRLRPPRMEA